LLQTKHCTGSKRPGNINMESSGYSSAPTRLCLPDLPGMEVREITAKFPKQATQLA
jgi:hypothetical protein